MLDQIVALYWHGPRQCVLEDLHPQTGNSIRWQSVIFYKHLSSGLQPVAEILTRLHQYLIVQDDGAVVLSFR